MRRVVSLTAAILCLVGSALAQRQPTIRPGQFSTLEAGGSFLMMPGVQKELGLSPATTKKIDAKMSTFMRPMTPQKSANGKPPSQEQMMSEFQKRMKDMQKAQAECVAMLTPAQKTRLRQISIQQIGAGAMLSSDVRKELALTPAQEKKIGDVLQQSYQSMGRTMPRNSTASTPEAQRKVFQEMMAKQEQIKLQTTKNAEATLTPAQRTKWKAIQGKPFKIDMAGMMRGRARG